MACDWVEIRSFHTTDVGRSDARSGGAAAVGQFPEWKLYRSQNNLEEGLLRLLQTLLPSRTRATLLADRGFGCTELARTCQRLGMHYVIRIHPDVWVNHGEYCGNLLDLPGRRGVSRVLEGVAFRKKNPLRQTNLPSDCFALPLLL